MLVSSDTAPSAESPFNGSYTVHRRTRWPSKHTTSESPVVGVFASGRSRGCIDASGTTQSEGRLPNSAPSATSATPAPSPDPPSASTPSPPPPAPALAVVARCSSRSTSRSLSASACRAAALAFRRSSRSARRLARWRRAWSSASRRPLSSCMCSMSQSAARCTLLYVSPMARTHDAAAKPMAMRLSMPGWRSINSSIVGSGSSSLLSSESSSCGVVIKTGAASSSCTRHTATRQTPHLFLLLLHLTHQGLGVC